MPELFIVLLILAVILFAVFRKRQSKATQQILAKSKRRSEPLSSDTVISLTKEHGLVGDAHYTDCVSEVVRLKRECKYDEAITLLLKTVEATERESAAFGHGWGVAPWYYEQLAIIYRKQGRHSDEISILERYSKQVKAKGAKGDKLKLRLQKAKQLARKRK